MGEPAIPESPNEPEASTRGFWSLIITQFQGAFSDNVLKNLVVFMMLNMGMTAARKHEIGELVTALFSLPFILFSMAGGYLADRYSKRSVMLAVKVFEVFVMLLMIFGLAYHRMPILLGGVFLMGTHSAFFGPSKYGSIPELLPERRLSWGNGILELGTFVAIILGTAMAAILSIQFGGRDGWSGVILVVLALVGLGCCLGITRVPAAAPQRKFRVNFVGEVLRQLRGMKGDRPLTLAMAGNTYFNFLGALLLLNLFFYGADVLQGSANQIMVLNVALGLGIGLGSVAAGYLSAGKIEYGLVPLGAIGLSILSGSLGVAGLSVRDAFIRLALLGFAGGFFIVPVTALLQHRPEKGNKGEVLAAANLLSFVGVFLVWPAHYLMTQVAGMGPRQIFLTGGVLTFLGAIYAVWLLPDSLLRFVLWLMTRSLYRITLDGRDNLPAKGGALFVCNHLSFVDALLLLSSTERHVRFIVYKGFYEKPWVKPFAKILRAIPISSELRPREMLNALRTASEAIRNGEVVCIFAEGQITRIGHMLPFRRGFERIMRDVDAPIIPIALDGVWGSIFSFDQGRFLWKLPRRIPYPVTINVGAPLPPTATPVQVRHVVQELMAEAWLHRKSRMRPLHHRFAYMARRHPFRFAMCDAQVPKLSSGKALVGSILMARSLRSYWAGEKMVGLLLPPSVGGALANYAAVFAGKIPVNLNYTVSESTMASCIRQCEIKTVLTSRAFIEKLKITVPAEKILWLEDVMGRRTEQSSPGPETAGQGDARAEGPQPAPSIVEKLIAIFIAWLVPLRWLNSVMGVEKAAELDDLATVIFSSGSTGEPKGVMLSHYNIGSNIEQLEQVFGLNSHDGMVGVLPFFHSFGFMATLWLPVTAGIRVAYHPNPLDAKSIGPLVSRHSLTFLLCTPTFLQLYLRVCTPEDFGSLRVVMAGAEKLPERLATAFEEHFGIRPVEGYGCTECSPAVAVNTHDFRSAGFRQVGAKRGKIGHPLPGMTVRLADPELGGSGEHFKTDAQGGIAEPRLGPPIGEPGLLLVKGPNVMQGYLGRPEKTAEVLHNGWYITGDIASMDEDGFLQITDRLSRFSKLGGEMVPHIKIEERLAELAGISGQGFIVVGVPDEKKGERLVVLHNLTPSALTACLEKFAQCDLPNLWKPRPDQFFHLEALPYLGTGKLDLRRARELAAEFVKGAVGI